MALPPSGMASPPCSSPMTVREGHQPTQCETILAHLEAGNTITPRQAFALCGSLALHSRIAELRAQGHRIDMAMRTQGRMRWGEYWLAIPYA